VNVIDTVVGWFQGALTWLHNVAPGGWGLMLVPLGILGGISLWVGLRNR
jgi:hypothetical protein